MPVEYTVNKKLMPTKDGQKVMHCATLTKNREVSLEEIAQNLSEASTLNAVDCYALMIGIAQQIANELQNGNVVNIDCLGSFRIKAKTHAVEAREHVDSRTIQNPSINFRPSIEMKRKLQNAKFVKRN